MSSPTNSANIRGGDDNRSDNRRLKQASKDEDKHWHRHCPCEDPAARPSVIEIANRGRKQHQSESSMLIGPRVPGLSQPESRNKP